MPDAGNDASRLLALHRVRDGALDARDAEEGLLGLFDALGDRGGDFLGLAVADADLTVAVADDHQGGEAEATTTLDDLGDTVDRDDLLDVVGLLRAAAVVATTAVRRLRLRGAAARSAALLCCWCCSSELQSSFAGAVGERRDTSCVLVAGAVEHDGLRCRRPWRARRRARRPCGPWRSCHRRDARRSASSVDAEASVWPSRSSTTWATMCLLERVTTRRGRSADADDLLATAQLATQARSRRGRRVLVVLDRMPCYLPAFPALRRTSSPA